MIASLSFKNAFPFAERHFCIVDIPQNAGYGTISVILFAYVGKKQYLCHAKPQKHTTMEATRTQSPEIGASAMERPIIDPNWRNQPSYTREEFMDELAKMLGEHYGLKDIREAL